MSLVRDWARCVMTRVGSTCLEILGHSALIMASRSSTLSGNAPSRMVLQSEPTGQWRRGLYPCYMSLECHLLSGERPCHHSSMFTTGSPQRLCQTPLLISHSLGASLICPCFMFGAVLPMCSFRRTRGLLGALGHTWRSASSLGTLRDTRHGSSTSLRPRR
jgi:hypothetical protein